MDLNSLFMFLTDADNACIKDGVDITGIVAAARMVVFILQIAVPIALIVMGTIDLGKAVISGDEKKMKEARKPFVSRLVSAVLVFLVPFIVGIVIGLVGSDDWKKCWNGTDATFGKLKSSKSSLNVNTGNDDVETTTNKTKKP